MSAPSTTKYKLNSAKALSDRMNELMVEKLAQYKYFQSRTFTIVIGISKIVHAVALMWLYLWGIPWSQKLPHAIFFSATASLTYFLDYFVSWVWWPNYYGTFQKEGASQHNMIICAHSPFFSGKYHISIHLSQSSSFLQRLPPPAVEATYDFTEFFTESGYMLENLWKQKVDALINQAIFKRNAK